MASSYKLDRKAANEEHAAGYRRVAFAAQAGAAIGRGLAKAKAARLVAELRQQAAAALKKAELEAELRALSQEALAPA